MPDTVVVERVAYSGIGAFEEVPYAVVMTLRDIANRLKLRIPFTLRHHCGRSVGD